MCHAIYSGHESVHAVGSRHGHQRQACSPQPVAYRSFVCVCVCKHVHMSSTAAEVLASKRPLPWATARASIARPCSASSSRKLFIAWTMEMVRQSSLQPIQLITSCASLGKRLFNCSLTTQYHRHVHARKSSARPGGICAVLSHSDAMHHCYAHVLT